jgi:hypothetical protein
MKRDPAKLLGSAVARSTQPLGASWRYQATFSRKQKQISFRLKEITMTKAKIAFVVTLGIIAVMLFIIQRPAQTQTQPTPMATRDVATTNIGGELTSAPNAAMLVGTQGSSLMGFRARTLIGCDQYVSKDVKGPGEFGLASGKSVYVCSYSISNAGTAQDVRFVTGTEASSGSGHVCNPKGNVSATFHLAQNQFVSQGSGVGSLFNAGGQGLCLKVFGGGDVSVNVTYATF